MLGMSGNERAIKALKNGDLVNLCVRLEKGADVNGLVDVDEGHSMLHYAAAKNLSAEVALLLKFDADTDIKTRKGQTADQLTTNPEIVKLIVDRRKIKADQKNAAEFLKSVEAKNTAQIVNFLSDYPALDLNAIVGSHGRTALHIAAAENMPEVISILLDRGLNIDAADHSGETPLHRAANLGNTDSVRRLLERGADDRLKNSNGKTAEQTVWRAATKDVFSERALALYSKKQEEAPPQAVPPPVVADEIVLTRPLADRALMEVFNFKTQEYTRMIRVSEKGAVEYAEHMMFPEVKNRARLKEAFEAYKQRGGQADETILSTLIDRREKKPLPGTGPGNF